MTETVNYAKYFGELVASTIKELILLSETAALLIPQALEQSETDLMDLYAVIYDGEERLGDALLKLTKIKSQLKEYTIPDLLREKDEFGMVSGYRGNKSEAFGYNLHVRIDQYPSLQNPETGFQYLKEKGYENAIKETVHAQTLRGIYNELCEQGEEIPEGVFRVATKVRAIPLKSRA